VLITSLARMPRPEHRFFRTIRHCGLMAFLMMAFSAQGEVPETTSLTMNVSVGGYPPYTIVRDDAAEGIMWDVLATVAETKGYDLEPMEVPRTRVDDFIEEGRLDVSPRAEEWSREPERFVFSDPVVTIREVVFARADSDFQFNDLSDLEGKTIITGLGYFYPELEWLFAKGKAVRFDVQSRRAMFSHLLSSTDFDLLISEEQSGLWILNENGWNDKIVVAGKPISEHPYRLMFNRRWKGFVADFNEALSEMQQSGELDQILDRYR